MNRIEYITVLRRNLLYNRTMSIIYEYMKVIEVNKTKV